MGWIEPKDRMPPAGLQVLLEVSGHFCGVSMIADHDFYLGCWIKPHDGREPYWMIDDASEGFEEHIFDPVVHAWMPLPKHFQPKERFTQEPDLMEHAMFEDEPDWLYKGDTVYEQMTLEDLIGGAT